ncbi:MAG: hypothetical protein WDN31_23275 [Hyphomicrobium sp.]
MSIIPTALRRVCALLALAALVSMPLAAQAEPFAARPCSGVDYNRMVLDIIGGLPKGGGYSIGSAFRLPTVSAHNIGAGHWEMRVYDGFPSHCASAAYTVFARLVAVLHNGGSIDLSPDQIEAFEARQRLPDGTPVVDGQGIFQIFNANGAGVAAFLKHTGTGISFRDDKLVYARPGDFLKIFWGEDVGASEKGHQVIYMGERSTGGRDMICFWGSQHQGTKKRDGHREALYYPGPGGDEVVDGYGEACRPREDIKEMVLLARHLHGASPSRARRDERQGRVARPRAVPVRRRLPLFAAQDVVRPGDARPRVRHRFGARGARRHRRRHYDRLDALGGKTPVEILSVRRANRLGGVGLAPVC